MKFFYKSNLDRHAAVHLKSAPKSEDHEEDKTSKAKVGEIPCKICGKRFLQKRHMIVHLKLHDGRQTISFLAA